MGLFGPYKCMNCGGSGEVNHRTENFSDIRGGIDVDFRTSDICPSCEGTGFATKHKPKKSVKIQCPSCYGSGEEREYDPDNDRMVTVRSRFGGSKCSQCHGSGTIYD